MWTRRWIRMFALTFIAVMFAASLALRLTAVNGIDYCGNALFPDFAQLYVSGQHILNNQGRTLYDEKPFYREVNRILNAEESAGFYPVYPPFAAVLAAPWTLVSYPLAAWSHALLCILVACCLARDMARYFFADSDDALIATLLFLAFLPLWRVWLFGQNSIWALAILWGSWRLWVSGAGLASGLVLSLGLFKPQLFVGAWLWAILWGNRRLRLGLILGIAAGVALGMICGGCSIWIQWLDAARHTTALVERIDWMTSLPHAWKLAGGENLFGVAWIYAVMVAGGVVWGLVLLQLRWKNASPTFALYVALLGGWLLTPRLYVYDWILAWPLLLAAWKYGTHRTRLAIAWGGLLFWIHDLFGILHVPILTLLGVAAFVWLLRQARVGWARGQYPPTG
jgi:hypothetical protein